MQARGYKSTQLLGKIGNHRNRSNQDAPPDKVPGINQFSRKLSLTWCERVKVVSDTQIILKE